MCIRDRNNAGYRSGAGAQGGYQGSPYQNAGQNGTGQNGAGQGGMGQNGQPHGSYSGYGSYQSQQGNYQYGSTFSNNDYGAAPGGGRQGKKHKEKKPRKPMNPLMKKVIAVVVCGVFVGVCAGVSFLAVNSLGNDKQPKEITQEMCIRDRYTPGSVPAVRLPVGSPPRPANGRKWKRSPARFPRLPEGSLLSLHSPVSPH